MITQIDIPFVVGLLYPGLRYHWGGGANGPYGDTLDAVRLEERAPEGEPLLTELPTESAIINAALDNCAAYPGVFDWPNLPNGLTLIVDKSTLAKNEVATITVSGAGDERVVVLRDSDGVDSVSPLDSGSFQFASDVSGVYYIHVFDRDALTHGVVTITVN